MLRPTDDESRQSNVDLPMQLRHRGRGTRSAVDSARSNDPIKHGGDQNLPVRNHGHDVLVRTIGSDAIVVAKAVSDSLAEVTKLGFGQVVGGVVGGVVED